VADVFAMFSDPAFRQAVSAYQHVIDFSCDITPDGSGADVRIEQAHGTDRIPSVAQKLVGDEIRFQQHESWATSSNADVEVLIPGKPGEMHGTLALRQDGADVRQVVEMEVKVSIPLVGGKLEDMIAGFVGRVFDAQHHVGVKWLRGEWRA
jgi:Protein of unknown function (DUF2505)